MDRCALAAAEGQGGIRKLQRVGQTVVIAVAPSRVSPLCGQQAKPGTAPVVSWFETLRRSLNASWIYPPSDFGKDGVRVHTDGPNFVPVVSDHEEICTPMASHREGASAIRIHGVCARVVCLSYRAIGVCHSNVGGAAAPVEGLHADLGKRRPNRVGRVDTVSGGCDGERAVKGSV